MRKLVALLSTLLIAGAVASIPSPALAADSQFGNSCTATTGPVNVTGVMTTKGAGNPLPITAQANGVITKATLALPAIGAASIVLKTMRATTTPNQYTVVGESVGFNVVTGTVGYPIRVPVKAGDLLGMSGAGVLMCATGDANDVVALIAGNSAVGSTLTYSPTTNRALSMVATVEPDADADGYGDTTQDLCPQSAAFQTACPVVKLDSLAAKSGSKINVYVAVSTSTNVAVTGVAKVNGKKVKLKGGTKAVEPGTLKPFKVKLPSALRSALAKLPPSKKITVTLTASSTDVAGRISTDTTKIKLPGTK